MAHDESVHHGDSTPHVLPIPLYLAVFAILVVGTILTYIVALYDLDVVFPGANTFIALTIALFKTACVVLYFMHVRYSSKLIWLTAVGGFFWLLILFSYTMQDYLTRSPGTYR